MSIYDDEEEPEYNSINKNRDLMVVIPSMCLLLSRVKIEHGKIMKGAVENGCWTLERVGYDWKGIGPVKPQDENYLVVPESMRLKDYNYILRTVATNPELFIDPKKLDEQQESEIVEMLLTELGLSRMDIFYGNLPATKIEEMFQLLVKARMNAIERGY